MNKTKLEFIINNAKKMFNDNVYKIMISLLLLLICLGLSFIVYVQKNNKKNSYNESLDLKNSKSYISGDSVNDINNEIYVDVKGEVKHPGVYKIKSSDRVTNIIRYAGGFNKYADQKSVNLSQKLNDQQVIIVNKISSNINNSNTSSNISTNSSKKINLNTADNKKLQELDSVGEKKADKIIDYRNQHNGFKSIEDLKKISGFGDKTFDKLKDYLEV